MGMKAMVLAAGLGERMRPLTELLPKPLLPIANRPVMAYILEHLARHGFTEVIANLYYRGEEIMECFGDGSCWGVRLSYAHEEKLWGIAGGVRRCRDFFGDDTFLVIGADDLTDMDLTELVARHREVGALASIGLAEVEETSQFGIVVVGEGGRIQYFVEKPKEKPPSKLANTQIYLFEPGILDFIPADQVYDFGFGAFPRMVEAGAPFYGFHLAGYWRDIGSVRDYLEAQADVMEHRVRARIEGEEVVPGVWLGRGCEVHPEARLDPPAVLGEGCRVRARASVGGATALGKAAEVREGSSLWNAVVWAGARIPSGASLRRCVITPEGVCASVGD
jgi:mannose-1-phosphate guanylyltransferase/phosphomannomutase